MVSGLALRLGSTNLLGVLKMFNNQNCVLSHTKKISKNI